MEIGHDGDFLWISFEEWVEEEDAGVIDEEIDFDMILVTEFEAFFRGVAEGEVDSERIDIDGVCVFEFNGEVMKAFFVDIDADEFALFLGAHACHFATDPRGGACNQCDLGFTF